MAMPNSDKDAKNTPATDELVLPGWFTYPIASVRRFGIWPTIGFGTLFAIAASSALCHLYYYFTDFALSLTPILLPILAPALTAPIMLYFCLRVIVLLDDAGDRMREKNEELSKTLLYAQGEAKRAEEAAQAKEQFIANMNHELRTPLNAVLGFSETIRDERLGPLGNPKYQEYAAHIHQSGGYLLSLINDTLDIARMGSGHVELEPAMHPLSDIVSESFELLGGAAEEGNITLEGNNIPDDLMVYGDRRAIKQVVINLMSNAVKFSKTGSQVEISAARDTDGGTTLIVSDTGIGIPETEIENVFEPFVRLDESATGTGLGLPLVKGIVDLHHGSIDIQSEEGVGTTVRILLPPQPTSTDNV